MRCRAFLLVFSAVFMQAGALFADEARFADIAARADAEPDFAIKAAHYKNALAHWDGKTDSPLEKRLAYERLAMCYLALNRPDDARGQMEFALALDSASVTAHSGMAQILLVRGDCGKAAAETDLAAALVPEIQRAPFYYQRGAVKSLCSRDDKGAIADFTKAWLSAVKYGLRETARKSLLRRGMLRCRAKEYAGAEKDIVKSQRYAKKNAAPEYALELGKCYQQQGNLGKAAHYYSAFIRKTTGQDDGQPSGKNFVPRLGEAYCRRGEASQEQDQALNALRDFSAGIYASLSPHSPQPLIVEETAYDIAGCYYRRGYLYEEAGEKLFALQDYEQACRRKHQQACKKTGAASAAKTEDKK
ncbi:MAG: hypothetical protein PHP45_02705 [Elusimicrobiales bacterium]|nr:hypothetical protein [Elusimicrobiales bacterium]